MKILFITSWTHRKNLNFILKCKQIDFHIVNHVSEIYNLNLNEYDAVYSPCEPIDVSKYPNVKFLFGPHFSIFPEEQHMSLIKGSNTVYNLLCDWVIKIWDRFPVCDNLKLVKLPFGVETDRFKDIKPLLERQNVFIYYKSRKPEELQFVENFLQSKKINYRIFSYRNKYDENEYLDYLQNSRYGIWLGAHESQGFALQEALSSNVPLLVWNIKSMNQEYGQYYSDIPATTIPYWNEKCGDFFYDAQELEEKFNTFINNLDNYRPRDFILENLSVQACEKRLIEFIENL